MNINKTILIGALIASSSLTQANTARPGTTPSFTAPVIETRGVNSEGFDDIMTLDGAGWIQDNQSNPVGTTDWFQGNDAVFPAQAGATTAYIGANFNNTGGSDICNWLILPDLGYLQSLSFWTRTTVGNTFPDRLQVVYSPTGGTTTGNCFGGFGDFTTTLLEINPALALGGYPQDWTQFNLSPNADGRFAFVYYVADGGPLGSNSNYIGIDTVEWVAGSPDVDLAVSVTNNAPGQLDIGDSVTFTTTVTNNGPGTANNTVVAQNFDNGLSYVSNSCGATLASNNLTWNVGSLANGASVNCTTTFDVDGYGRLNLGASVSADETDTVAANNNGNSGVNGPVRIIPTLTQYGLFLLFVGMLFISRRKFLK
jgi:uncharacterized repeat protein (TIGR01451 family)